MHGSVGGSSGDVSVLIMTICEGCQEVGKKDDVEDEMDMGTT